MMCSLRATASRPPDGMASACSPGMATIWPPDTALIDTVDGWGPGLNSETTSTVVLLVAPTGKAQSVAVRRAPSVAPTPVSSDGLAPMNRRSATTPTPLVDVSTAEWPTPLGMRAWSLATNVIAVWGGTVRANGSAVPWSSEKLNCSSASRLPGL